MHLDMPFMGTYSADDYYTGTNAALHGGTTMVIDFILQTQGRPLSEAWKHGKRNLKEKLLVTTHTIWQ